MFFQENKKRRQLQEEREIEQLLFVLEDLHQKYLELLKQRGHTPESAAEYLANPSHFSEEEWHFLETERERMRQEKLVHRTPLPLFKAQKTRTEQKEIRSHWLLVR